MSYLQEENPEGALKLVKRKGLRSRVATYYASKGFSVKHRVANAYGEFDLTATKEEGSLLRRRITLLIDCRKCERGTIPLREFVKFVRKFVRYYDHYESRQGGEWKGVYVYVGRLDTEIRPYWKSIPDKDWIRLQHFQTSPS